jgi:N-acetyl-anhydromuramyl-L-alanine amidase AmpD
VGTKFENEVQFLLNSPNVSAHYIISKQGLLVQMLDPVKFTAWHAGNVSNVKYSNAQSIGVEVHYTPGEGVWTGEMWQALTFLANTYSQLEIVTHRGIAIPKGRKIDPSGVSDGEFTYWKLNKIRPNHVVTTNVRSNLREAPTTQSRIITTVPENTSLFTFSEDTIEGQEVAGTKVWRKVNCGAFILESLTTPKAGK